MLFLENSITYDSVYVNDVNQELLRNCKYDLKKCKDIVV